MIRLSLLVACLMVFASAQVPSTTDWRGLSPLKSSRMDVERVLGPPDQKLNDQTLVYRFPDMVVEFYFAGNPNCQQQLSYNSWNVTSDTLTGINISLSPEILVAETGIDLTKYKKIKGDFDLVGHYVYLNEDRTFAVEVGNDSVAGYHYYPGSKHTNLPCERSKQR